VTMLSFLTEAEKCDRLSRRWSST